METKSHNGEAALLYAVRKGNRIIMSLFLTTKQMISLETGKGTWSSAELKVLSLVLSSIPTSSTFGRKTIPNKTMSNRPLYCTSGRQENE